MPDSQSSEPGYESHFATVSKIGHVRSLTVSLDSGGNVSELSLHNCCLARMLPSEAELVSE